MVQLAYTRVGRRRRFTIGNALCIAPLLVTFLLPQQAVRAQGTVEARGVHEGIDAAIEAFRATGRREPVDAAARQRSLELARAKTQVVLPRTHPAAGAPLAIVVHDRGSAFTLGSLGAGTPVVFAADRPLRPPLTADHLRYDLSSRDVMTRLHTVMDSGQAPRGRTGAPSPAPAPIERHPIHLTP